jgi:anti-anti-sigma factor
MAACESPRQQTLLPGPAEAAAMFVWSVCIDGPCARLTVAGELTAITAARLHETLRWLAADGHLKITVDLAGIKTCDCAGMDALIAALRQLSQAGGRLILDHPSTAVRRLLGLSDPAPPAHTPRAAVPAHAQPTLTGRFVRPAKDDRATEPYLATAGTHTTTSS